MAQQSARRDQENQGFPPCLEHALGDLDLDPRTPIQASDGNPPAQQAGQMAASDYVSETPEFTLALKGASTDGKRTLAIEAKEFGFAPTATS